MDYIEGLRAKFAIWMNIRTSEIKTEYCFFKEVERIVFMALCVVEMMRISFNIFKG